jgi:SAM-dependent methyltransferase
MTENKTSNPAIDIQRAYYASDVQTLDPAEGVAGSHDLPISLLLGYLGGQEIGSLLDVGAGTGRTLSKIRAAHPNISLSGVEPSPVLRRVGLERWGLAPDEVIDGDALALPFPDRSFDMVTAFGMLHHIKNPGRAVSELARVARKGVFISDANCYGQGGTAIRLSKRVLRGLGLWSALNYLRTGGKGYFISEGDGLYYSYSLIDDLPILNRRFEHVMLLNPVGHSIDHAHQAPTLVAIARDS